MEKFVFVLGLVVAGLLFGIVGSCDVEEAERQQQEYCDNVKAGTWPDFKGTFKRDCR